MKNLLYGLLALAVVSCGRSSGKAANVLTENNFEQLDGWMNGSTSTSLTQEKAHSGTYSVKVNPGIDYSLGYNSTLGKLSSARLNKVKLHGWVFVPNDKATAVLVTEVKNPGQDKSALWEGISMKERGGVDGFNKWIEVERDLTLPQSTTYNSQILVYLWRGDSSQPVYLDDVQLLKAE